MELARAIANVAIRPITGSWRLVSHVVFWAIIYLFFLYLKSGMLEMSPGATALLTLKDLVVIGAIYYFLFYFGIQKLLLKKKVSSFILALLAIYYFYALALYIEFTLLPKFIQVPGQGFQSYSARVLAGGVSGIFRFRNGAEIFLDLSYLLSPALIVKLAVELMRLSTRMLKMEMDNLNLELAFLKAQINPHFLFNTLNNVYSLALHRSDRAAEAVLKLSDLMRYTLYDSNIEWVPLEKELQFFNNYLELERMRYSNRLTIDVKITGIEPSWSIAPLIIFPFIENAFKHGIDTTVEKSNVTIRIDLHGSELTVDIKNSKAKKGKGASRVGGIGISNTRKRLNLLYKDKHSLSISDGDEFAVHLKIDLINQSHKNEMHHY